MESLRYLVQPEDPFPPLDQALTDPNGLLAVGGDLSVERLVEAYRQGIFPWFDDEQPILWWSPDPRCIVVTENYKISRSLRKLLNKNPFRVTIDQSFTDVLAACAAPREDSPGTWITEDMHTAYCRLHYQGYAHSIECWQEDQLVGGLYGVSLGRVFFGESMFSRVSNASTAAFIHLVQLCQQLDFPLIDCQVTNPHLLSLGAEEIPRQQFARQLQALVPESAPYTKFRGSWAQL